jgi:hypothetical protein
MRDLHLLAQQSPPILLKRYRRNAVMALEPGQGRKTAALRDAHQVPLLTGSALFCLEDQNRSRRHESTCSGVPHTVSRLEPA